MKKIFLISTLIFSIILLSGCGPEYQTTYSYNPPHSWHGRKCVNRCLTQRSYCRSQCQTNDQSCQTNANMMAMPEYLHYVHHRHKHHKPAYMQLSDFADYSNCSSTCGCESTYRDCFSNCGGTITASTQCVAFCNQKQ